MKIRDPKEIAHSLYNQALELIDISTQPIEDIIDVEAETLMNQVIMLRQAADMIEAAAVLRTVEAYPNICPNCGTDIIRFMKRGY